MSVVQRGFTRLPKRLMEPFVKINSEGLGTRSSKWTYWGCTCKQKEGVLPLSLDARGNLWPEYRNWRYNIFVPVGGPPPLSPLPAVSLDPCPALCWCYDAWGPCLWMTVSSACPWSHVNLLLGPGCWAQPLTDACSPDRKLYFKEFQKACKAKPHMHPNFRGTSHWGPKS